MIAPRVWIVTVVRLPKRSLKADFTLTMAAAKIGLFTFPAYTFVGQVIPISIGIPEDEGLLGRIKRQVIDDEFIRQRITQAQAGCP